MNQKRELLRLELAKIVAPEIIRVACTMDPVLLAKQIRLTVDALIEELKSTQTGIEPEKEEK